MPLRFDKKHCESIMFMFNVSSENYVNCKVSLWQSPVRPVLSGHLKIDKTKVLMEKGSLMKVESIVKESNVIHSS